MTQMYLVAHNLKQDDKAKLPGPCAQTSSDSQQTPSSPSMPAVEPPGIFTSSLASRGAEQKAAAVSGDAAVSMTPTKWQTWLRKMTSKIARSLRKSPCTGTGVGDFVAFCKQASPTRWRRLVRQAIPQLILTDTIATDLTVIWPPRTSGLSAFLGVLARGAPPAMSSKNTGRFLRQPTLRAQPGKGKRKVAAKVAPDSQETTYMQGRARLSFQYEAVDGTVLLARCAAPW